MPTGLRSRTCTTNGVPSCDGQPWTLELINPGNGFLCPTGCPGLDHYTGGGLSDVIVAEVDGDGSNHLVVANGGSATVAVVLRYGGRFQSAGRLGSSYIVRDSEAADMDLDGDLDLVSGNDSGTAGSAWRSKRNVGQGAAWSQVDLQVAAARAYDIAVGDMNGDGWPDIVSLHKESSLFAVQLDHGLPVPGGS